MVPTLRFRPAGKVPTDVIPSALNVPSVDARDLAAAMAQMTLPPAIDVQRFFSDPDFGLWESVLTPADGAQN